MVETKDNELEQLSDEEVNALWEEAFAGTKVSSDFTIEIKRAVLEIRRHEIAQLPEADIDVLWKKTVSDAEVSDLISGNRNLFLHVIQSNPRMLSRLRQYIEDENKPSVPLKPIYVSDVVRGTYRWG